MQDQHQADMEALRKELTAPKKSVRFTNSPTLTPAEESSEPSMTPSGDGLTTVKTVHLSDRLPDPPMFTGKRKDLPLFISRLRMKLEGNADRYPTKCAKLIYAHSRLDYDPATLADLLIGSDIATVEKLIAFLRATYDDPNRTLSAWSKLNNLKQGKRPFLSHFAEFRRLVADTNLNKEAQINALRRSLSNDLRRAMVGAKIPSDINEYANLIAQYDNDLRYLPTRPTHRSNYTYKVTTPRQQLDPDAMEIDTLSRATLSEQKKDQYRRKGLCFTCSAHGHIARECTKKTQIQTMDQWGSLSRRAPSPRSDVSSDTSSRSSSRSRST